MDGAGAPGPSLAAIARVAGEALLQQPRQPGQGVLSRFSMRRAVCWGSALPILCPPLPPEPSRPLCKSALLLTPYIPVRGVQALCHVGASRRTGRLSSAVMLSGRLQMIGAGTLWSARRGLSGTFASKQICHSASPPPPFFFFY